MLILHIHVYKHNIQPQNFLCLTFTKAAGINFNLKPQQMVYISKAW